MTCLLEKEGYVVSRFSAFPSMKELVIMRADCIIINEWLPNVSGHAICLMLKAKVQTTAVPVILTSTVNGHEHIANLCEADAILKRPLNMDDLLPAISSVILNRVPFSNAAHHD